MKDLEKMLMKKKDKGDGSMDEMHRKAKMEVIQELIQMAKEEMGSRYASDLSNPLGEPDMQEVKVMAEDEEGLEKGLDKAKDVLGMLPGMDEDEEDEELG